MCTRVEDGFFSVRDNGYLHIAKGKEYQGSIAIYDTYYSRYITGLFQRSMDITICGVRHCLDLQSFVDFLKQHNIRGVSTDLKNFDDLIPDFSVSHEKGPIRSHISQYKRDKLDKKMIDALVKADIIRARKYLGKGANPNCEFWFCDYDKPMVANTLGDLADTFPQDFRRTAQAGRFTPILYSAFKKRAAFIPMLKYFDADSAMEGELGRLKSAFCVAPETEEDILARPTTYNARSFGMYYLKTHALSLNENDSVDQQELPQRMK
jgi:hypothetical protein